MLERQTKLGNNTRLKIILSIILAFLSFVLLGNDFYIFIFWWACLLVLGLVFLPLTANIFESFSDNGYYFSKVIGIALTSYLMWFLSSIRLLKFRTYSCIIVLLIFLILNILIYKKTNVKEFINNKTGVYFNRELIFFTILLIAVFIRGFKPEAYGTEKFMDYGFMTSMMRTDFMPPEDFWFAGEGINYYYVGQFIATFLSKLSFVPVTHGYNLMLMTIAAFSFVIPYTLVYNIAKNLFKEKNIKVKYSPHIAGIISGAAVSLAGNMHFSIFYFVIPTIQEMLGIEPSNYWFSNSTRYIGYHPETADKTIHEFPSYSFILGDLHAHVLNIIFVLTLIGVLYAWLIDYKKLDFTNYKDRKLLDFLKDALDPKVLLVGFLIGLFHMTNFWDFPIYIVVAGGTIVFSLIRNYSFTKITFLLSSINAIVIIVVAELVALPFIVSFDQISTNILLTSNRTPFYQLLILWGLPIIVVCGFLVELVQTYKIIKKLRQSNANRNIYSKLVKKNFLKADVVLFFKTMTLSDLFVLIIGLCAIGLVFIPELIYVEDIYSGDFKRANTMFKLTYQAFIMFGISSGYIFIKFFKAKKFLWQKKFNIVCFALFVSTLIYFPVAVEDWYGNVTKVQNYKGLDASAFLKDTMAEDYHAINWINENIKDKSVILEANGDSYTDYQRISVFTGHSTVLGWYVHEWLWRGDTSVLEQRASDIETIYKSDNQDEVMDLINKYNIDYIYVGKLEKEKFIGINHDFLNSIGEKVYESTDSLDGNGISNSNTITYIIKIK